MTHDLGIVLALASLGHTGVFACVGEVPGRPATRAGPPYEFVDIEALDINRSRERVDS